MTYPDFEARWRPAGGAERANYGLFLQDLCDLIGVPRPDPTTDNPAHDAYVLERAVEFNDGGKRSTGRIDLYKRGCFILEAKQGTDTPDQQKAAERAELGLPPERRRTGHALRGTARWEQMMQAARQQALGYLRALPDGEPRPLFVLVADVGYCLDLYANFTGVGEAFVPFPDQASYRLPLAKLADENTRAMLKAIFEAPRDLDPSRRAARVTRELAGYLAGVSAQLERAGHAPDAVAQFLMRCLFTMFSEDVGLIPKESFTGMLRQYAQPDLREFLPDALESLWRTMDTGGFSPDLKARLRRFNGKLFHDATALPLTEGQMSLLLKAAEMDWTAVEPAIFGTLLERALDPRERHRLGAHYTPRRYVERLVLPTVLEPLRREWAAAQAASARRLDEGNPKEARAELVRFLNRLTGLRILDPACGSGNFLYVTLEHLKRLEGEVLAAVNAFGQAGLLELGGGTTVGPRQLLGLELNPRAAAIADVVLKIGYLQWHLRTHGPSQLREPLLDEYENIHQQDAVLAHDEGFENLHPAEWPEADFIVGNPPFVGDKAMRGALGDAYVEALRKTYKGRVPESSDLVMYWWDKAAEAVASGKTEAFGFITTNSITQTFNRRVIQRHLDGDLSLTFAIPDHPWVDSAQGAAVRIAMSVARAGKLPGTLATVTRETATDADDAHEVVLSETAGTLNADFTVGADVAGAETLKANTGITSNGMMLAGSGFIVSEEEAKTLGLGRIPGLEARIRPYRNGKDLTARPRGVFLIDMFGLTEAEIIQRFPEIYQHLFTHVKPERDVNNRKKLKEVWWEFGETRKGLRSALKGLSLNRYIATVETAKHRFFQFVEIEVTPDHKIVVIALDDAYHLGILSSHTHIVWALATGSTLEDRPVYPSSRCFQTFPFPDPTDAQKDRIRDLAEQLDAHRKRQQAQHPTLTLTDLYNVVEKLRTGEPLNAKEQQTHQQGLASVVQSLHQQLDAAVADAYGWPVDLPEAEILTRLVRLNHERAREEEAGLVRYLRPAYQAPGQQQLGLGLSEVEAKGIEPMTSAAGPQPWPKELAQQMQAVREVVRSAGEPLTATQVAGRFGKLRPAAVQPLLDTLATLALLRPTDAGAYAA